MTTHVVASIADPAAREFLRHADSLLAKVIDLRRVIVPPGRMPSVELKMREPAWSIEEPA
jgi:hypothetical protein